QTKAINTRSAQFSDVFRQETQRKGRSGKLASRLRIRRVPKLRMTSLSGERTQAAPGTNSFVGGAHDTQHRSWLYADRTSDCGGDHFHHRSDCGTRPAAGANDR